MIAIDLNSMRMSLAKLQRVRKKVKDTADEQFRQKLYYMGELAVRVAPQFSGDFASNFSFLVDGRSYSYRSYGDAGTQMREGDDGRFKYTEAAHKAGDPEAVGRSLARMAAQLRGVTIRSRVRLVNATDLDTDGVHMTGPDGTVNLRPENIIPGRVRIEAYLKANVK